MAAIDGFAGQADYASPTTDINSQALLIQRMMNRMQTATLVQVIGVSIPVGSAIGVVDVLPLVNQIDGAGKPTPHTTIYGIPYFRLQGGSNAIIMDPAKGDIGMCCFASRDISAVKANRGQSNPGTRRKFSMSDGLYVGGYLNGPPTQFISFTADGIKVVSPKEITLSAPAISLVSDSVVVKGSSLKHNAKNVGDTHTHPTPTGTSGVPNA